MCGLTVHKTLASIFRSSVTCQNCLDDSTLAAPAKDNQAQASKRKGLKPRVYKPEDFDW